MTRIFTPLRSFIIGIVMLAAAIILPMNAYSQRTEGPILFYTFSEVEDGDVIRDMSGVEPIVDLRMTEDVQKIDGSNGVVISDDFNTYKHGLFSIDTPTGLCEAIKLSGAFTYEAWLRPASSTLGECRVVGYSNGPASWNA